MAELGKSPGLAELLLGLQQQQPQPLQIDPAQQGFLASGGAGAAVGLARSQPMPAYAAAKTSFEKYDPRFIGSGIGHNYNGYGFYFSANRSHAENIQKQYMPEGKVNSISVDAKPHELLNLDANIAKMTGKEKLLEAVQQTGAELGRFAKTGRDVLNALESVPTTVYRRLLGNDFISTSQQGVSELLKSKGFKGNTYSDANGQHYVIYDFDSIKMKAE